MENGARKTMPLKLNLKVLLCLFFSVQVVTSFSLSKGISQNVVKIDGMKNFTLEMGDEINRIELNILSNETKYWFLMEDSVHFCREINSNDDDSSEEDGVENKSKCKVKLSFSLLKMDCKSEGSFLEIEIVSRDMHGNSINQQTKKLCKNDEYIYHAADSDKHFIAYLEADEQIILTPVGDDWSGHSTHAKILVSLHYEIINQKCPSKYFDCNENCKKDSSHCKRPDVGKFNVNSTLTSDIEKSRREKEQLKSVCIPQAWLCDKLPNCGVYYDDSDEAQGLCFWNENGDDESTSGLRKLENFLIAMVDVIFYGLIPLFIICVLFKMVFRKYQRRNAVTESASRNEHNINSSPELVEAGSPSSFGAYFNSRRKSEEPPTYDEVVQTTVEQSTTTTGNGNELERRRDTENGNENLQHPRT